MATPDEEWSIISSSSDLDEEQSTQSSIREHSEQTDVPDAVESDPLDNDDSLATLQVPKFMRQSDSVLKMERSPSFDGSSNVLKYSLKSAETPDSHSPAHTSVTDEITILDSDRKGSKIAEAIGFYEDLNRQIKHSSKNIWAVAMSKMGDLSRVEALAPEVKTLSVDQNEKKPVHSKTSTKAKSEDNENKTSCCFAPIKAGMLKRMDDNSDYLLHYLIGASIVVIVVSTYGIFRGYLVPAPVPPTPYHELKELMGRVWAALMYDDVQLPWYKRISMAKAPLREAKFRRYVIRAAGAMHARAVTTYQRLSRVPLNRWLHQVPRLATLLKDRTLGLTETVTVFAKQATKQALSFLLSGSVLRFQSMKDIVRTAVYKQQVPVSHIKASVLKIYNDAKRLQLFEDSKRLPKEVKLVFDSIAISIYRTASSLKQHVEELVAGYVDLRRTESS